MNGWIGSAENQWSAFRAFRILLGVTLGARQSLSSAEVRRNTMGHKILVVDDEEPIRDLLTGFLEGQGHTVVLASNGKGALLLAEKESPHLIVLDVRMPGLDGIETCAALRANEKTRAIPIILATAFREV